LWLVEVDRDGATGGQGEEERVKLTIQHGHELADRLPRVVKLPAVQVRGHQRPLADATSVISVGGT
jgi:hypothetical protein